MIYISKENNVECQKVNELSRKEYETRFSSKCYEEKVDKLRGITDVKEFKKMKTSCFPYRMVHGYPVDMNDPYVGKCGNIADNGRLLLDFDHQSAEDIFLKFKLAGLETLGVLNVERSISGNGCHVDVKRMEGLDREQNINFYENLLQVHIDHSCKDVRRKCFIVPQKDVLYTTDEFFETTSDPLPNIVPEGMDITRPFYRLNIDNYMPQDYHRTYQNDNEKELEVLVDRVLATGIDITNTYDAWYRIGFCIDTECGLGGLPLFQKISSLYPRYDWRECQDKYYSLHNDNRHEIHIGSFVWIAREFGAM